MRWEYVPIIGFLKCGLSVLHMQHLYHICSASGRECGQEFDATWRPFVTFQISGIVTFLFLIAIRMLLALMTMLENRSHSNF